MVERQRVPERSASASARARAWGVHLHLPSRNVLCDNAFSCYRTVTNLEQDYIKQPSTTYFLYKLIKLLINFIILR